MKLGFIDVTNYNGQKFYLGNKKFIKKGKFNNKKGFYIRNNIQGQCGTCGVIHARRFDTDNLTNLIEILADNIGAVHKFAGIMDAPLINYFKKFSF